VSRAGCILGEDDSTVHGTARTVVEGECRRCLTPVATPLQLESGALFTQTRKPGTILIRIRWRQDRWKST